MEMENVRGLVLDTLLALERKEDYSHRLIKSVLDKYDYLETREKSFIKRVTEGALERQPELDYYLDHYSSVPVRKMRPLIRCLMRMSVYQLLYMDSVPDSAVCNEACKLAGKRGFQNLKGFVNGLLRTISKNKDTLPLPDEQKTPVQYLSVKYSMPEWLVELWLDEYGWKITEKLLRTFLESNPVSLRFSIAVSAEEREGLCRRIRGSGATLEKSPYLPYVYRMEQGNDPSMLPGFREGMYTVQDISSALAVEAAEIGEKDFVIDVCAAPGGKSILAAEKAKAGRVLARDISQEKTALIAENICRMRAANVEVQVFDGVCTDEELTGKADVVLLDVPCSGLGVIGRKGDIKYRATREGMESLAELQKQIVRASARYVKPGGTLLYSTCTIHSGENEAMVCYIARELGYKPVSIEKILPRALSEEKKRLEEDLCEAGKKLAAALTEEERACCIQLLPGYMEADGFFIARFQRESDCKDGQDNRRKN